MNLKEDLDKRICDCEDGATNTQTYREYMIEVGNEFGLGYIDLDNLSESELEDYLDYLDFLCEK